MYHQYQKTIAFGGLCPNLALLSKWRFYCKFRTLAPAPVWDQVLKYIFGRFTYCRDCLIFAQCLPNVKPFFVKLKYFVLFANLAVSGCFSHCRETNEWPTEQRLQERAAFQLKAYAENMSQAMSKIFTNNLLFRNQYLSNI